MTARSRLADPRWLIRLGALGSALLFLGSLGAGAMPGYDLLVHVPVLSAFRSGWLGLKAALAITYVGLAILIGSWLLLGRILLDPDRQGAVDVRTLQRALALWCAPLLVCAPLFSRDLYAYAAQAQIAHAGLNPYVATPADLPGRFLDEVAWRWVDSPAPYGPLWLMLGKLVAAICGQGVMRTVFAIRLLAVVGVALTAWLLPKLARRIGGRPEMALWLGVLNPLVLLHLVAGGHNDALMIGLAVAGLAIVATAGGRPLAGLRGDGARLALGAAVLALAVAVKSPAVVMLAFAVPLWARQRGEIERLRTWALGVGIAAGAGVAAFAAVTAASGLGLGWVKQVNNSVPVVNWLSLPTSLAMIWRVLHGVGLDKDPDGTVAAFRTAGTVITVVALVACWAAARRWSPMTLCAIGLGITTILGPNVQPWYYAWALAIVAATGAGCDRRVVGWLAFGSVGLMLTTLPEGDSIISQPIPLLAVLIAAGVAVSAALSPIATAIAPPRPDGPSELAGPTKPAAATGPIAAASPSRP
jgi:alpha-1,6-mannosyltransferase